ncbi:MAG: hypothetical protein HFJ98_07890 [Eubacterium sp.]|nr:hypothetical protein [Eubacterium sp.]
MAKENKKFNYGLYAVSVFIVVAAVLVLITSLTFKSKYVAFDKEKVAVNFVDTVAQKGDGYNAYKFTLAAKSEKYGDFVRQQFMYPIIYPGYEAGMDKDAFKELKKTGLDTDEHKSDATKNDDGSLAGEVARRMLSYYEELMQNGGWDDYSKVYTSYFNKLVEVRKEVFGDDYMSDEVMFTALEANVASYGNSLTGTEKTLAADGKTVIQEESTGAYQTAFGKDYKFTVKVTNSEDVTDLNAYKAALSKDVLDTYGVSADDITAVSKVIVAVALDDGTEVAHCEVSEVKIGSKWYVDNTSTDTDALYSIGMNSEFVDITK